MMRRTAAIRKRRPKAVERRFFNAEVPDEECVNAVYAIPRRLRVHESLANGMVALAVGLVVDKVFKVLLLVPQIEPLDERLTKMRDGRISELDGVSIDAGLLDRIGELIQA